MRATSQTLGDQLGELRSVLDGGAVGALIALDAPDRYVNGVRLFFESKRLSVGRPETLQAPAAIVPLGSLPGALRRGIEHGDVPEGWTADVRSSATMRADSAMNVIGWLEGSDPALRDEYVVFTAHMDHVGTGRPVNGDSIYNGADDDASGTAGIVELAQAFATGARPRRSLVFMTVSGEEKGLLGSEWYSEHPLFPLEKTVANLNMDMIGRNWTDTIVAIGKEESSLGAMADRIVAEHPELGLEVVDDMWPEERFYFRSDHYNFARRGVPILFFFNGVHADYHRPSDEPEKIDSEKAARIVRLVYLLGLEIANADEPPAWDPDAYRRVVETLYRAGDSLRFRVSSRPRLRGRPSRVSVEGLCRAAIGSEPIRGDTRQGTSQCRATGTCHRSSSREGAASARSYGGWPPAPCSRCFTRRRRARKPSVS